METQEPKKEDNVLETAEAVGFDFLEWLDQRKGAQTKMRQFKSARYDP